MFSYRHAFHAGNHADVLKHITLLATMRHLMQKEAGITLIDTHAGAGLYRLDGDYSQKGAEAKDGLFKLLAAAEKLDALPDPVQDYLEQIASFNPNGQAKIYPGSPFLMQKLMRHASRDRLRLFELHPTDSKSLMANIAQLDAGRTVTVSREDGFEALKKLLPPPPSATGSKRAMVLIDPSYEIKSDYIKVANVIQEYLKRFSTGTYLVWYPIIPRPEAHELPRRLRPLAGGRAKKVAGRPAACSWSTRRSPSKTSSKKPWIWSALRWRAATARNGKSKARTELQFHLSDTKKGVECPFFHGLGAHSHYTDFQFVTPLEVPLECFNNTVRQRAGRPTPGR